MNKELLHFAAFDQHVAPVHFVLSQVLRDVLELFIKMAQSRLSQHVDHLLRYLLFVHLVEVHEGSFEFVKLVMRTLILVKFELVVLNSIRGNVELLLLFFA